MDEKVEKVLNGDCDILTDEQKEKARACKDLGELTACLSQMGVALPDELLDAAAGGFDIHNYRMEIWYTCQDCHFMTESGMLESRNWKCPFCTHTVDRENAKKDYLYVPRV